MAKIPTGIYCRNPYNVTGICNRSSCPLANSRYATIREGDGVLYLCMKAIERAHMPNKSWERVQLQRNYEKALGITDKHQMYWPRFLVHKTKQRLKTMTQMRIRMRKLALKTREKIMTTPRKEKKREARREEKTENAAQLEESIEKELMARLLDQTYPDRSVEDILNYLPEKFDEILEEHQLDDEEVDEEPEVEYVEGYDEVEREDDIEDFNGLAFGHSRDGGNVEANEEADNRKRMRNETAWTAKRIEKEEGAAKPKRARVLVELAHEGAEMEGNI